MFSLQLSNKVVLIFSLVLFLLFAAPMIVSADGEGGGGGDGGGFCCGPSSSVGSAIGAIGDAIGAAADAVGGFIGGLTSGLGNGPNAAGLAANLTSADLNAANVVSNPTGALVGTNSAGANVYGGSGNGPETAGHDGFDGAGAGEGDEVDTPVTSGSCTVSSCPSALNACGFSGTGNKCTGGSGSYACTAAIPALPSYLGTACSQSFSETICGESVTRTAFGSRSCSDTCVISTSGYPAVVSNSICDVSVCPSGTSGTYPDCGTCPTNFSGQYPSCSIIDPPEIGDIDISLQAKPTLVGKDQSATITWASVESTGCSVSGTNGDAWSGPSGRVDSSPITEKTVFTLTCTDSTGDPVSDVETVYISPAWQEF